MKHTIPVHSAIAVANRLFANDRNNWRHKASFSLGYQRATDSLKAALEVLSAVKSPTVLPNRRDRHGSPIFPTPVVLLN